MVAQHYLDLLPKSLGSLPGFGPLNAKYAVVGLAPTPRNDQGLQSNDPFGQRTLDILERLERSVNEAFYLTNLVKEPYDGAKTPPIKAIRAYTEPLFCELEAVGPKKILALGAQVAKALCGESFKSIRDDHGALFYNDRLDAVIVPTYAFAAGSRSPEIQSIIGRDLERFFTLERPPAPNYLVVTRDHAGASRPRHIKMKDVALFMPLESRVFLDIETTGLDPAVDNILSIGFLVDGNDDPFIILNPEQSDLFWLQDLFFRRKSKLVGHNLQFDLFFLSYKTGRFWDFKIEDTMLMSYVAGESILSLKHLTTMKTNRPGSHAFGGFESLSYLAEDVLSTREIYNVFDAPTRDAFARHLLHDLVPTTVGMRLRGVHISYEMLTDLDLYYQQQGQERLEALQAKSPEPINWNSAAQVANFLLANGVKLTEKTPGGAYAVSEAVLLAQASKHPVAQMILDYRESEKMRGFITNYKNVTSTEHPYLHPRLLLHGTRTGRLSCQDPNLQQVPRVGPIKKLFTPRWEGGKIGLIDLSQAELRVAALLSNDELFTEMLLSGDAHRANAAAIYGKPESEVSSAERKKIKGVTFGLLYGGSPGGLAFRVGVPKAEVEQILKKFFLRFPKLSAWIENTKKDGVFKGEVFTILGRRRDLVSLIKSEGQTSAERKAVNTPVQSTASDITLCILRYVSEKLRTSGLKSRPMIGVHDSVLIEIAPDEIDQVGLIVQEGFASLKDTPLGSLPLFGKLPLVGEFIVGDSWAHIESTNENYGGEALRVFPCSSSGVPVVLHPDQDEDDEESINEGNNLEGFDE